MSSGSEREAVMEWIATLRRIIRQSHLNEEPTYEDIEVIEEWHEQRVLLFENLKRDLKTPLTENEQQELDKSLQLADEMFSKGHTEDAYLLLREGVRLLKGAGKGKEELTEEEAEDIKKLKSARERVSGLFRKADSVLYPEERPMLDLILRMSDHEYMFYNYSEALQLMLRCESELQLVLEAGRNPEMAKLEEPVRREQARQRCMMLTKEMERIMPIATPVLTPDEVVLLSLLASNLPRLEKEDAWEAMAVIYEGILDLGARVVSEGRDLEISETATSEPELAELSEAKPLTGTIELPAEIVEIRRLAPELIRFWQTELKCCETLGRLLKHLADLESKGETDSEAWTKPLERLPLLWNVCDQAIESQLRIAILAINQMTLEIRSYFEDFQIFEKNQKSLGQAGISAFGLVDRVNELLERLGTREKLLLDRIDTFKICMNEHLKDFRVWTGLCDLRLRALKELGLEAKAVSSNIDVIESEKMKGNKEYSGKIAKVLKSLREGGVSFGPQMQLSVTACCYKAHGQGKDLIKVYLDQEEMGGGTVIRALFRYRRETNGRITVKLIAIIQEHGKASRKTISGDAQEQW